jgi:hypothetical protein
MKTFLIVLGCIYLLAMFNYVYDLMDKSFPITRVRTYGDYCAGALITFMLAMSCFFFVAINP